jgi:hypothetical protein
MQDSLHTLTAKLQKSSDRILTKSMKRLSDTPTRNTTVKRNEYYGGDPCNGFHALRQFLLNQGIETRVFSFGSIALPKSMADPAITNDHGSVDNSFYFEFHKVVSPEFDGDVKVNALVLLVRCFFVEDQDSTVFHIQLVLNHHRDAIFELNRAYDEIISMAEKDGWNEPSRNSPTGRVTFFEKKYTSLNEFKKFVKALQKSLTAFEIYGNNLIPVNPVV